MSKPNKNALRTLDSGQGVDTQKKEISINGNFKPKIIKRDTKQYRIISLFCDGRLLSCLDSYWTGDTCLHSTVDKISKRFNLEIPRERGKLSNRRGELVSVVLYRFSETDIAKMKPLL